MKKQILIVGMMSLCATINIDVGYAQTNSFSQTPTEHWQSHQQTLHTHSNSNDGSVYYKKGALKPSKHHMNNPLRRKGWHTQPDPYIEEGGVYTKSTHPALNRHGDTMSQYVDHPSGYMSPPSTVRAPGSKGQQSVKITDPSSGNVAPISLPPEKN